VLVTLNVTYMDLSYLPDTDGREGHMSPNQDVIDIWKSLREETQYNHIFEIGLNAGHSAAINLELFPDVKVTSLDIGRHEYTHVATKTLKERFGDRFDYHICDSRAFHQRMRDGVYDKIKADVAFVDGGHDFKAVIDDIAMSKWLGVKDVFVDDTNTDKVGFVCDKFTEMDLWTLVKKYKYYDRAQVTHYRF